MGRRIGIVGGIGPLTTVQYYERIMAGARARGRVFPEVVIYSLSHPRFKTFEDPDRLPEYVDYLMEAVHGLERAGADILALAANSPHRVLDDLRLQTRLPIVSAVEAALRETRRLGLRKVLLLGIRFTMQSSFFQDPFARDGIAVVVPDPAQQDEIQRVIDDELNAGDLRASSRAWLLEAIAAHPVDGVLLACMRLPLLLEPGQVPVPVVNTLDLHISEILDAALEGEPPPA